MAVGLKGAVHFVQTRHVCGLESTRPAPHSLTHGRAQPSSTLGREGLLLSLQHCA